MIKSRLFIAIVLLTIFTVPGLFAQETEEPNGKLAVIWTSGDPDVAHKVCLMYTHAAKKYGWFREVTLIVWGPSQRLLVADQGIREKVLQMKKDGIIVEACIACANSLGLTDAIKVIGIEVKGMGAPLTEYLKTDWKVLTF